MPRSNRCWSSRVSFQNASPSVGSRVDSHAAHSLSSITIKSMSVLLRQLCSAMARSGWGLREINTSAALPRCPRSAPCAYSPSARSNTLNRRQPQASIQSMGVVVVRALSLAACWGFVRKVLRRAVCSISTRRQPIERSSSSSQSDVDNRERRVPSPMVAVKLADISNGPRLAPPCRRIRMDNFHRSLQRGCSALRIFEFASVVRMAP
jgi:hypothetical protein